jgi:hypothetical protein
MKKKNKTALDELIDWVDEYTIMKNYAPTDLEVIKKAEKLKEKEKEQIISAVLFGVEQLCDGGDIENDNRAEQYYNQTYAN